MRELKAKWVFDQEAFSKALIACTPMGTGYHLHLVRFGRQGRDRLERQRGGWRLFKTIVPPCKRHGISVFGGWKSMYRGCGIENGTASEARSSVRPRPRGGMTTARLCPRSPSSRPGDQIRNASSDSPLVIAAAIWAGMRP